MRLSLGLARELPAAQIPAAVFRGLPPAENAAEIERLALELVWRAGAELPHALGRVAGGSGRLDREPPPHLVRGQPWELLRRLWFDAATKVPVYAPLWWRGELRGRRLHEGLRLARNRSRLETLVDGAERGDQ